MKRRLLNLEKFTYTVNYNAEGATVLADGEEVGVISGGVLIFNKYGNDAKDSYSITFTGGTMTKPEDFYTFTVNPTTLSFESGGGSQSVNVTSTLTTYSNSHATGTVSKNSSVTLQYNTTNQVTNVNYTGTASGTGLSVNGTNITFAANPNYSTRSGSVTFTQNTSNKTATVTCNQAALSLYNYTVYSNCNGGTVYFNNVNKGTVSGGSLSFTDEASSGTVRISGGVPSNNTVNGSTTTEYGYSSRSYSEEDSTRDYDCSVSQTSFSFGYSGGTQTATVNSSYRDGTRSRTVTQPTRRSRTATPYTTYTYTAPANKTCQGNSSVTMNYTSSTSTGTNYGNWSSYSDYGSPEYGSWGSWNYGSWHYQKPTISAQSSWAPGSISGSSEPWTLTVTCSSTTSSRSDYFTVNMAGGKTQRINLSQSAPSSTDYKFYWCPGNNVSTNNGTSINENEYYAANDTGWHGFNCCSKLGSALTGTPIEGGSSSTGGANSGNIQVYNPPISNYWSEPDTGANSSRAVMYRWTSVNDGYYGRIATVTAKQPSPSNKSITVSRIIQLGCEFNCGYYHSYKQEYTYDNIDAAGDQFQWRICFKWHYPNPESSYNQAATGMSLPANGTWSVKSKPSWVSLSKSSGSMADNDTNVQVTIAPNLGTSSRSGDLILQNNIRTNLYATYHITQAGAVAHTITIAGTKLNNGGSWTSGGQTPYHGLAESPSISSSLPGTWSLLNKPSTSYVSSISISNSSAQTTNMSFTSNTRFTSQTWTLRHTATNGSICNVTIVLRGRDNVIRCKSNGATGRYLISRTQNPRYFPGDTFSIATSGGTAYCDVVIIDGSNAGPPFIQTSDSYNTSRTFYVYDYTNASSSSSVKYLGVVTMNSTQWLHFYGSGSSTSSVSVTNSE